MFSFFLPAPVQPAGCDIILGEVIQPVSVARRTVASLNPGEGMAEKAEGTAAAPTAAAPRRAPKQQSLFAETAPEPGQGARPPSASAAATMQRRWRALTATAPINALVANIHHQDIDDEAYDLRQLAISAIDLVVSTMGYGQELTVEDATDHLITLAREMNPAPQGEHEHQEIASAVLSNLLNANSDQRRFSYRYADMAAEPATWAEYTFKLLQLRETEHGDCLIASDQAVMLYVRALDTDLEDAEYAHAVLLARQLADGRLDSAEFSADDALRTSTGFAATLATLLTDTTRDVASHDWAKDVPARLSRAHKHIKERIGEDGKLLEYLRTGLDTDVTDEGIKDVCKFKRLTALRLAAIKITDIGSMTGLAGMAMFAWASTDIDKETETGYEKTSMFNGFKSHEKYDKSSKSGELSTIVGGRFVVEASGYGVDMEAIKDAVTKVDLKKLDSMKGVGVQ